MVIFMKTFFSYYNAYLMGGTPKTYSFESVDKSIVLQRKRHFGIISFFATTDKKLTYVAVKTSSFIIDTATKVKKNSESGGIHHKVSHGWGSFFGTL